MAENQPQKEDKKGGSQTTATSVIVTILIILAIWYFQGGTEQQTQSGAQPSEQTEQTEQALTDPQAEPAATEETEEENSVAQAVAPEDTDGDKPAEQDAAESDSSETENQDSEVPEIEVVEVGVEQEAEGEPDVSDESDAGGQPEEVAPDPETTERPKPEPTETNTPAPAPTATNTPEPEPTVVPTSTPSPTPAPTFTATPRAGPNGMRTITMGELPPEAIDTINLIWENGPFPFDKDDTTFGNRERLLPIEGYDYYREFTVITPGLNHRGARRIVEGAEGELYYTEDHYESFYWVITE